MLLLWLSAPPDPEYRGKRFSTYLHEHFSAAGPSGGSITSASEAFREKGNEAGPLLASWLETENRRYLQNLRDFLQKFQKGALLPADRQNIALKALDVIPALGATRAVKLYLKRGNAPEIRNHTATLFMLRFNSASSEEQQAIAAESEAFIADLLDGFQREGRDDYVLALIAPLVESKAVPNASRFEQKIRDLSARSRYLRRAARSYDP